VQSLFPAPSPIPPSAQRAHSQGGRTLARGNWPGKGQSGPARIRGDGHCAQDLPATMQVRSGHWTLGPRTDEARLRTFAANLGVAL